MRIPKTILKHLFFLPFFLLMATTASFGQQGSIGGILLDEANRPVTGATVTLKGKGISTVSDSTGAFRFEKLDKGDYELEINRPDFKPMTEIVHHDNSDQSMRYTVPGIAADAGVGSVDNLPTISIGEDELKDNGSSTVSSILNSSRDPFVSAATYSFSVARFRIRGYDDDNFITFMNGIPMMDLSNGRTSFNAWSGLNDVIRSRESSIGMSEVPFSFGGIGGAYNIDSRASRQRKQLQVTYSASNRTYDNRFMVTYGSGINSKGWSTSFSYSRRWAEEGFVPGTFYDGNSFFAAVEKQINSRHSLSLTGFGSFTTNGRAGLAIKEIQEIAGSNYYNPLWGYQNGHVRNSSVAKGRQPVVILEHDWKIDESSSLQTSVAYNAGSYKVSGMDWYNAADPRPDYYRNLPSFDPFNGEDPEEYNLYAQQIRTNLEENESARQIQWDRLYEANAMNDTVFNGTSGTWAKYIVGNRVTDTRRFFFNSTYSKVVNDRVMVNGGLIVQQQTNHYYRTVEDLLGADFYVDLNQFGDFNNTGDPNLLQNDLNNPNRIVHVGDRYGYDYAALLGNSQLWGQGTFLLDRFDCYVGLSLGNTTFQRDGYIRNGIFPDDSYGKSARESFINYGIKGGTTYKYNGRNYFVLNAQYRTRAPYFENAFVSPSTRNLLVDDLVQEKIMSVEGGYILKSPRLKAKVMGYVTQFNDGTDTRRFYHEEFNTFVNYSLTGIDKRHIGLEIGAEANLGRGFSATAVASVGQFVYTSRPLGTATQDNKDTVLITDETIYIKDIRVANGPQSAYSIGVNYRSPKFWFASMNLNYFDHIYTDVNPARRTLQALDLVNPGTEQWVSILSQERLPGQMTLDVSAGYSWRLNNRIKSMKRPTYLNFNLGITNLLNNEELVTTAFEQLRFDFTDNNPNKFPAKYGYAFGTTFFLNIVYRMN